MALKTKWEKSELLRILNESRSILRCDIQRRLKIERNELIKDIDIQIKKLDDSRHNILMENNLLNLEGSRYGCDIIPLHPALKIFDEQTNIERKNILEG